MKQRLRLAIRGAVQGVGFRPFVYRLACELELKGWVLNSPQGVTIEVEGGDAALQQFLERLEAEKPPRAFIQSLEASYLDAGGLGDFAIRPSATGGPLNTVVLPDIAVCPECVADFTEPHNRRYRYPFTNCTHCGPRFTIIDSLPYDRANTTMKKFVMCAECQAEYENPLDRRFHAQPNACPRCGPHVELWDAEGLALAARQDALDATVALLREGRILALKGVGGFHLIVDAANEAAVGELRKRKHRDEKPLAVMFPSLAMARECCLVSNAEARLLQSPESPIVLLARRLGVEAACVSNALHEEIQRPLVAASVAPGNPNLGVMLPYTPLHYLLLLGLRGPVVATSGNLSDEPICIDELEALSRLRGIADAFLVHDRPILRHMDDSVARIVAGRELILRRARGYAPLPITAGMAKSGAGQRLAVGAHLKSAIALSAGADQVVVSQHIGDLETSPAFHAFERVIQDLQRLYQVQPRSIACDLHPDYLSTQFARHAGLPNIKVQHHFAHVAACMAENDLHEPVLGISWDGTGYGPDGTVWGGEFLLVNQEAPPSEQDGNTANGLFRRFAAFRPFRLPGGEAAVREPRRSALGLLYALWGEDVRSDKPSDAAFSEAELALLLRMLKQGVNCPLTSSAGRLFDAVASLVGVRQKARFEGQAAMELEFAIGNARTEAFLPFRLVEGGCRAPWHAQAAAWEPAYWVDWEPAIEAIVREGKRGTPGMISAQFHNMMAEAVVAVAERAGQNRVALTGGCFQNKYLLERAVCRLRLRGFQPYWHQRIPPNDGGIAFGQWVAAGWMEDKEC